MVAGTYEPTSQCKMFMRVEMYVWPGETRMANGTKEKQRPTHRHHHQQNNTANENKKEKKTENEEEEKHVFSLIYTHWFTWFN